MYYASYFYYEITVQKKREGGLLLNKKLKVFASSDIFILFMAGANIKIVMLICNL